MLKRNKGFSIVYVLILLVLVVGVVGAYVYWKSSSSMSDLITESGTDSGSPISPLNKKGSSSSSTEGKTQQPPRYAKPIAPGSQTYLVSGKFEGPAIAKVTIDPQDAKAGQQQKITIEVSDTVPVTRVYVTVKLDSKSNTFDLKLVSGSSTSGVWEASAPFPDDTLFSNYTITENAESSRGKSSTTTTIR